MTIKFTECEIDFDSEDYLVRIWEHGEVAPINLSFDEAKQLIEFLTTNLNSLPGIVSA